MASPAITDQFEINWKEKQYMCKRIDMDGSIAFVIEFTQRPFYLCKATDSKGDSFWVTIPNDTKLSHVVLDLGRQIDAHYAAPMNSEKE